MRNGSLLRRFERHRARAAAGAFCLAVALPLAASATEAVVDYLYVEASSGSSAGGHAGIRFGDEVYHFQHEAPGIIRASVEDAANFDLEYRGLGNRPIHVQRIAVSQAAYERLRDAFRRRYVVQETHLEALESARRDVELLQCLVDAEWANGRACGTRLDGAGYFFAEGANPTRGQHDPAMEDLRLDIERVYGPGVLDRRRDEIRSEIERLRPQPRSPVTLLEGRVAVAAPGLAGRYSDLLLEWLALGVIAGEARPVPAAFRRCPGPLSEEERDALAARAAYQRRVALDLLTSARVDRGYPLMISLARQVALRASIDRGELFVLDTYAASDANGVQGVAGERIPALAEVRRERHAAMRHARSAAMAAPASDEQRWSQFEVVANVALELDGALAGRPLRRHQRSLSPARGASLQRQWPAPRPELPRVRAALDVALARQERIKGRLTELYRYDLVRRNCVTEIFRTLDGAPGLANDLGGRVPMRATANFIPFMSAAAVGDTYRVIGRTVLPSYRQLELRRILASSDDWTALLREETSLTSTIVPFDPDDEVFLFFSTDTIVMRPLVGAANVVFGVGAMITGMFSAPFDGASLLRAGARGALYSAPELAFVNIRKGSVRLLPSDWASTRHRAPAPDGYGGSK